MSICLLVKRDDVLRESFSYFDVALGFTVQDEFGDRERLIVIERRLVIRPVFWTFMDHGTAFPLTLFV